MDTEEKSDKHSYNLENKQLGIISDFASKIVDELAEDVRDLAKESAVLSNESKIMSNITSNYLVKFKDTIEEINRQILTIEKNTDSLKKDITIIKISVEDIKRATFSCRGGGNDEINKKQNEK